MEKSQLARDTSYYTIALTAQKVLAFIYFWLVSNSLTTDALGQYVFALSFTTLFSIVVDFGLSPVLTREASKNTANTDTYFRNVLGLKIPLAIGAFLLSIIVITLTTSDIAVRNLVYLASFIMVLDSFAVTCWVLFRAHHNLRYESVATILVQIIIFTLGVTALKKTGDTFYLMAALLTASTFNMVFALILVKIKLHVSLRPLYNREVIVTFLKILPAFALAGIFVKIYNAADSVLLGYLDSSTAVGYYAVPAKVVYALQQIIPAAFAAVIFPTFSYYYAHSREQLGLAFENACKYLLLISIPLTAGILAIAQPLVATVWPEYTIVVPAFMTMALAMPFIFLAFPTGYLLNASDKQFKTTLNRGIVTVLCVALNIALIPYFSFFGSAMTFLITNIALLALDWWWVRSVITIRYTKLGLVLIKCLIAAASMVVVVLEAEKMTTNLLIIITLGAISYGAVLYALNGFRIREVIELFKRPAPSSIAPDDSL